MATSFNIELADLSLLISLPRTPISVKWMKNPVSQHTTDAALTILLKFSEEDYRYVVQNSTAFETKSDEILEQDTYDTWIAPLNIESITAQPQGEYVALSNVSSMAPNLFTQAKKSPFIHGRLVALGDGFVFLSLYSM